MMRSIFRFFLGAFVLMVIAACGQNTPQVLPTLQPSATPVPPTTTPIGSVSVGQAQPTLNPDARPGTIRIVHAAPDTPTLNMYAGFQTVATNLDFTQSTQPTPLDAGDYPIQIAPSGSRPGDMPLFEGDFTLESAAKDVVVVAKNEGQFELLTFPEAVLPLNEGESIITFINAVSGAANVTVQQDGTNLTDPIPFGQSANSAVLPSGETTLNIQPAGGNATTFEINLEERQQYTLVLAGQGEQVAVGSFSMAAPGRTTVRGINASEAAGAVDIYLNDDLLAGGAEFSRPTDRKDIISGDYEVRVFEAGADAETDEPLAIQKLLLDAGQNISLLVVGSENRTMIVPYAEDLSPTPPGQARVAFLNTLDSVATLHVETSGGPLPDVPDMSFGQPPEDTLLSAEQHNFYSTRAGATEENMTVETVQNVLLEQGTYYLYLVAGRTNNDPVFLSEDVGIDEAAVPAENEGEEGLTTSAIELRFVNAIADQTTVDFQINGEALIGNIAYGQGSAFVAIEESSATLSAVVSGTAEFLQSSDNVLESGNRYTVIVYGADRTNVQMMVVPDAELIFDGQSPHVRLINLSVNADIQLGLGFSAQDPTPAPPNTDLRRSIPSGVQRLVDGIEGSRASSIILTPMGTFDLEIIDSTTNQLATTLSNIELAAGAHYDVFVYEELDTTRISGFVLKYPMDSE